MVLLVPTARWGVVRTADLPVLTPLVDQQERPFPTAHVVLKSRAMPRQARPVPTDQLARDERLDLLAEQQLLMGRMAQQVLKSLTDRVAQQAARDLTVLTPPPDQRGLLDPSVLLGRMVLVDQLDLTAPHFLTALPFLTVPMVPLVIERIMS